MKESKGGALIKEMAAELNLSVGTVSVVLNGRGDKMRISKKTQERVKALAAERGYHPNIYARRLRNAASEEYEHVIAVFWNYGYGDDIMSDFLKGLQEAVDKTDRVVAFNIHMFEGGHLKECEALFTPTRYSAVIVCGTSAEDSDYLGSRKFDLPVISAFHNDKHFPSVYVDNFSVGVSIANLFYEKGVRAAGYFGSKDGGINSELRKKGFFTQLENLGITIKEDWKKEGEKRYIDSGMTAMRDIIGLKERPEAIFINVPEYAVGAFIECRYAGFNVGKDIYLLAAGTPRSLARAKNRISAIITPIETMAEETINMVFEVIQNDSDRIKSKILQAEVVDGCTF